MNIKEKHKRYNVNFFKRIAPIYNYAVIPVAHLRVKVANKIKKPNARILDMACGTGSQSIAFAKRGFSVVGVDLSPDMLRYANQKIQSSYDIKFICGDAAKIDYADSTFDVSSVSFALHDMPEEVALMVLKEMIRVTKKDGQIIIADYCQPKNKLIAWLSYMIPRLWETQYYNHFMQVGLDDYLKKAGLKIINRETYFLGIIQIVECGLS